MKSVKSNINSLKNLLSLILILVTGMACDCYAQTTDTANTPDLDSIIKRISVLNHFDLNKFDSLTLINEDTAGRHSDEPLLSTKEDMLIGWLIRESNDSIFFLESSAIELSFKKERVKSIRTIGINDSLIDLLNDYHKSYFGKICQWWFYGEYEGNYNMPYYLVSLWLYQKGNKQSAFHLLRQIRNDFDDYSRDNKRLSLDATLERHFGNLYYNLMLVAYSVDRDYAKAIEYGSYFNYTDFKDFYFTKTATELTEQLKKRKDDFKSFCIPDSLSWVKLKATMDRKEQFIYLAERLRLLNCRQHGQPDDINFHDPQNAGSKYIDLLHGYKIEKWQSLKVINPYNEILAMKPEISEVETFLPYLNDTSYIPTYWYWRDFNYYRKVYRLNEVIEDLIFRITKEHFFEIDSFNCLTADKKKLEIEKIREWCSKNSSLSKEELNRKIISESHSWEAFENAMDAAVESGDTSTAKTLVSRYSDSFSGYSREMASHKARIAEAIYSLGSVKDTGTIRSWYYKAEDRYIQLWTSLFLLKNDKEYYEQAFDTLSIVMKDYSCSNCYYYAIKPLISFKNERTLKLAEGLFNLHYFETPVNYIDYKDQIKLLFLAKSEVAFKFLYDGLMNLDTTLYSRFRNLNGKEFQCLYCDPYVDVVDKWRASKKHNYDDWDIQKRRKYSKELAQWLKKQFKLICADKKHNIILEKEDAQ